MMKEKTGYEGSVGDSYLVSGILGQDFYTSQRTLDGVESRIAERKKIEYQNMSLLERQRQKLEETLNLVTNFGYSGKNVMVRSKIETEMMRIEIKKAEEKIRSFRDVERLEYEKRKITGDMAEQEEGLEGMTL